MPSSLLTIHPLIQDALFERQAVVALESTIISHGMPYPQNIETALAVEQEIKEQGALPASIVIHQGQIHIGADEELLMHFATANDIVKASRRDLSYCLAKGLSASTTVAATMYCAHQAGIKLFATGGIGGVHPGAELDFDVSADLFELGQTPVHVVCAGAKAILDLPKTLEVLESHGVPVVGFETDEFPSFYSRQSGYFLNQRADSPLEVARMIKNQEALGLNSGILICNPINKAHEIPQQEIWPIIQKAQAKAKQQGIEGKALTPYLLSAIAELSQGKSLKANIELIKNNAKIAGQIASCYTSCD